MKRGKHEKLKSHLHSSEPLFGLPIEHGIDESNTIGARIRYDLMQVGFDVSNPSEVHLGSEAHSFRPIVLNIN